MPKAINTDDLFKKIITQEKVARDFGFYWEHIGQLLDQIKSECGEIEEAFLNKNIEHLKEEIGDVMSATISLCIFCGLDPSLTLNHSIEKFQKRYDELVFMVNEDGLKDLVNKPLEVLLSYWDKAKKITEEKIKKGTI